MGAGQKNLCPPPGLTDIHNIDLQAVVNGVILPRHLLPRRKDPFCTVNVYENGSVADSGNDPRHDFADPRMEFVIDGIPLRFTDALHDNLLRGLGRDPPEILRDHFLFNDIANLIFFINGMGFIQCQFVIVIHDVFIRNDFFDHIDTDVPGHPVDLHSDILRIRVILLICRDERLFDGVQQGFFRNIFFSLQIIHRGEKFSVHDTPSLKDYGEPDFRDTF